MQDVVKEHGAEIVNRASLAALQYPGTMITTNFERERVLNHLKEHPHGISTER